MTCVLVCSRLDCLLLCVGVSSMRSYVMCVGVSDDQLVCDASCVDVVMCDVCLCVGVFCALVCWCGFMC